MIEVNVSTLFVVAVVAGVGAYFGSYLREKGKNLATHEDINRVVRATEEIKEEVSSGAWLRHRRWDLKWECYSKLAEDLGELATLLQEVIFVANRGPVPGFDQADIDNKLALNRAAANAAMERHRRYASIARIVVPAHVRTFLSTFAVEWNQAVPVEEQYKIAHKAWIELLDLARADLLGEAREMQPAKGPTS